MASRALPLIGSLLYAGVAVICLVMGVKNLGARRFLPFQQEAAGADWDTLGPGLQAVVLSQLRLSGLGFLVVGLLLAAAAWGGGPRQGFSWGALAPLLSLLFCAGLWWVNLRLHQKTGARTPWKGSLYASVAIAAGLAISLLS